ncbi:hypothetical protein IUY40_15110 [Flavobacterium sp. ALJ2]|uniref:hypothetical protein n=1 Tax=Flavobacterium sp. ALJ2 TaxID=2786960 RepID=UPI00189E7649|nr:hypothetical protein [Flavobacterium sp. ALJ2]MBF7092863.1 hypothetical protein [Flavobacterium sp. ALJ2]
MKLFQYGLLLFFAFSIISCKDNSPEKKEDVYHHNETKKLNLDKILKINEYIFKSSESGCFFTTSYDDGTVYDPEHGNDLGNLVTFLIPKNFNFFKKHSKYINKDDYEKLEKYVNKLSIEELKKAFDIYVLLVDKKYLVATPGYDSAYKFTDNYQTDVYQYRNNAWEKIESFIVDSDEKHTKETEWRYDFIENKTKETQIAFFDSISKLKIDDSWYRDYILLLDSYEPNYNYTYYIKISKDSVYIAERALKDLLVPFQNEDTLFLYHKKNLLTGSKYIENKQIPEVKIVKVKDKYYVTSEVFDLKNSISTKPAKYGFLNYEMK